MVCWQKLESMQTFALQSSNHITILWQLGQAISRNHDVGFKGVNIRNFKDNNFEKPFPGCLGIMINLSDVSPGMPGNRLLACNLMVMVIPLDITRILNSLHKVRTSGSIISSF